MSCGPSPHQACVSIYAAYKQNKLKMYSALLKLLYDYMYKVKQRDCEELWKLN